ncbi:MULTISPECIES: SPFH domain-containing protein [Methylomonas]|uniref:SPFH domain-containing protein n=1 Tax=Methylomonas TaxID=416 RepID=UPI001232941F|nr:SPFH domain-containing protein [Methylomonas rhizoryzae]
MPILDGLKRQLRSVIEWQESDPDILFAQWSENGDEIKNASKLIVGPGQGCIFVYQGQVKAVIEQQCLINLQTDNVPFWTTIKKFMQFFESEHKVGLYFFRTSKILDQKWGTSSPIKYQDPAYHIPVGLKAYGNFSYQITDPNAFFVNVVGSHGQIRVSEFRPVISARIVQPISDYLAECGYSFAQIDANREEIARGIGIKLAMASRKLGFAIGDFRIEGTDFDDDTLRRINRIADVTAENQAARAAGVDYAELQRLEAVRDAARNESGAAGAGVSLGAGVALGQSMLQGTQSSATPPGADQDDISVKLAKLKQLYQAQLISDAEYAAKKQELLEKL